MADGQAPRGPPWAPTAERGDHDTRRGADAVRMEVAYAAELNGGAPASGGRRGRRVGESDGLGDRRGGAEWQLGSGGGLGEMRVRRGRDGGRRCGSWRWRR
jgi:hypothetical protein